MAYLIFLLFTIALLGGFLAVTALETRRGVRVFPQQRARLDREAERAAFIIAHVDFASYLREESRRLIERMSHDLVHLSLQTVRAAERILTRLVRRLRTREGSTLDAPRESAREFVKTLADFKGHLEATRPEIPDINEVQ